MENYTIEVIKESNIFSKKEIKFLYNNINIISKVFQIALIDNINNSYAIK